MRLLSSNPTGGLIKAKLTLILVLALILSYPARASTKQERQHAKRQWYHANGYIKAIGKNARRTIYHPKWHVRHKWQMALHYLVKLREEADRILHPPAAARNGPFPLDYCTVTLLSREGGMNPHATNPHSGAYGGPQALPGSKMASAGSDWADNIWTQIRWMQGYVQQYGGMCAALAHSYRYGWY